MTSSAASSPRVEPRARDGRAEEPSRAAQWLGVLLAPATFVAHLEIGYVLVYRACRYDAAVWLHVAGLASVLLAAAGAWLAWRVMADAVPGPADGEPGDARSRSRFMGIVGLGVSALLTVLLAAQWLAVFFIHPCQ